MAVTLGLIKSARHFPCVHSRGSIISFSTSYHVMILTSCNKMKQTGNDLQIISEWKLKKLILRILYAILQQYKTQEQLKQRVLEWGCLIALRIVDQKDMRDKQRLTLFTLFIYLSILKETEKLKMRATNWRCQSHISVEN